MPEAPRDRPEGAVVLQEFQAHIRARPKPIFESLAARFDPGEGAKSFFTADAGAWLVIVQGGWWYRAEYRVVPDDTGARVEYALVNASGTHRRIGRRARLRIIDAAPKEFERLIGALRTELE
ncbi:MAG TPA: hypothetical protein PJ998_01280 [Terrimesophilobacter sp.]|nr:hypothetical protein [Terrimesophilobacter sp.]